MAIDPTTDEKFAFFDADERQFLARMGEDHPSVVERFKEALQLRADARETWAEERVKQVPRTGWLQFGFEKPETIHEHLVGLAEMVNNYLLRIGASALCRVHMVEMAKVHDLPEAVVGDFTVDDPITTPDKHRLELLAARVIFENNPYALGLVNEYTENLTHEAQWLHDLDKIHALRGALFYQSLYPDGRNEAGKTPWDEFYPNVQHKFKTDEGKTYLAELMAHPMIDASAPVITHAR